MERETDRWDGFGLRDVRQTVFVQFPDRDEALVFPGLNDADLDFLPGDTLPVVEEDGARSWRVAETNRRERIGEDGAIEREWLLKVEPTV